MPRPSSDSFQPSERAEELYLGFLRRVEVGEAVDFDGFCAEHPLEAADLAQLHDGYRHTQRLANRIGFCSTISEQIRLQFGVDGDTGISLERDESVAQTPRVLDRLQAREGDFGRYRLEGELGRGGAGVVFRVWDEDLRRPLAMKVLIGVDERVEALSESQLRSLGRFLEEAQVTGQLDHPGIVPIHELGINPEGHLYFTMKLVKGEELGKVLAKARENADGWNLRRAVGVLVKVCEAVAYAHNKGVVHRDLKPANVMVGRFGAVYTMDWGLAHILGLAEKSKVRIGSKLFTQLVQSDRRELAREAPDSPLVSHDGDVVGTPYYMAPEQVSGRLDEIGPAADVYGIGALIHHLLAGRPPFSTKGETPSLQAVLARVVRSGPDPIEESWPGAPAELVAIANKAMSRRPSDRYGAVVELAEDLRAWTEGRRVSALKEPPWAGTPRWVRRHPLATGALGGLALAAGLELWRGPGPSGSALASGAQPTRPLVEVLPDGTGPLAPVAEGLQELLDEATSPERRREIERSLRETSERLAAPASAAPEEGGRQR